MSLLGISSLPSRDTNMLAGHIKPTLCIHFVLGNFELWQFLQHKS